MNHTALLASLLLVSCGGSDNSAPDAAALVDANERYVDAPLPDATKSTDANASPDASVSSDATPILDATPMADADPNACHAHTFGGDVITLQSVGSLPAMTGGTIPTGTYDAVAFKMVNTGLTGSFRGTWVIESGDTIHALEQLMLGSNPPPEPTPRTLNYSTSGINLTRTRTCGGTETHVNEYSVRSEADGTYLDVREMSLMFTFKKRS